MCMKLECKYTKARRVRGYKLVRMTRAGTLKAMHGTDEYGCPFLYRLNQKYKAVPSKHALGSFQQGFQDYEQGFHVWKRLEDAKPLYRRAQAYLVEVEGMATHRGSDKGKPAFLCKDLTFLKVLGTVSRYGTFAPLGT